MSSTRPAALHAPPTAPRPWFRLAAFAANLVALLAAAALVWGPEFEAYHVQPPALDDATIRKALRDADDKVLLEVGRQRTGLPVVPMSNPESDRVQIVLAAERLLAGQVHFPKQSLVNIRVPFEARNLDEGLLTHQLFVAGLGTADLLIQAWRINHDERFYRAAVAEAVALGEVDRKAWLPRAFLWNDHALANRIPILIDILQVARTRADFDDQTARQLFGLAARTAERLAKPSLFTFRTNHGVMQNLALLQYAAAFPGLEGAARLRQTGCERLVRQVPFFISPEGPVLEHSASYHEFGRYTLEMALRLFELNHCKTPPDWAGKLVLARKFSTELMRPDKSQPALGDTDQAAMTAVYSEWPIGAPANPVALYPASGFAVWWRGLSAWPDPSALAQTVVTWSSFPSRAHKRSDDMSVMVWAQGHSWLDNAGYWPYGHQGFNEAQGWRGSNAPHLVGEPGQPGLTQARLVGSLDAGRLRALELERPAAVGQALLRRQIVEIDGNTWLVADSFRSATPQRLERVWHTTPELQVRELGPQAFMLEAPTTEQAARLSFVGELSERPVRLIGSLAPFGGWAIRQGMPVASTAIAVLQAQPETPVFSVLETGSKAVLGTVPAPTLDSAGGARRWALTVQTARGPAKISWNEGAVALAFADGAQAQGSLAAPDEAAIARTRTEVVNAYQALAASYPVHRDLAYYRYRLTSLALGLLVGQELALLAIRRWWRPAVPWARLTAAAGWLALGLFAAFWYLH